MEVNSKEFKEKSVCAKFAHTAENSKKYHDENKNEKGGMMKKFIILSFLFLSCFSDKKDNPIAPLKLNHNSITMKPGDSWLYKRLFINIPDSGVFEFPDTIIGYSYFIASKDTILNSKNYLIVDGKDYEIDKDSIYTIKKRCAIHFSDTIEMYEFGPSGLGGWSGPMKRTALNYRISERGFGTLLLKKILLSKLLSATNYDTSVYRDFVYPIMFPLMVDSVYVYRPEGDPRGNLPYRYRFLGIENFRTYEGTQQAYKYEFLTKETFSLDSLFIYSWIGLNGLFKRYTGGGHSEITDDTGKTIGTVRSFDISELIGRKDINPDTLKPWGKP